MHGPILSEDCLNSVSERKNDRHFTPSKGLCRIRATRVTEIR